MPTPFPLSGNAPNLVGGDFYQPALLYGLDGKPLIQATPNTDTIAQAVGGMPVVMALEHAFDEEALAWVRKRSNSGPVTALVSASRAASAASGTLKSYGCLGIVVELDVTVNPGGAETLQLVLRFVGPGAVNWDYNLNTAQTYGGGGGNTQVLLYPGISFATSSGTGSGVKSGVIMRDFVLGVVHSAAGAWTYQLKYALIGGN